MVRSCGCDRSARSLQNAACRCQLASDSHRCLVSHLGKACRAVSGLPDMHASASWCAADVAVAEPDYKRLLYRLPNDPLFPSNSRYPGGLPVQVACLSCERGRVCFLRKQLLLCRWMCGCHAQARTRTPPSGACIPGYSCCAGMWYLQRISAPGAWDSTTGSSSVGRGLREAGARGPVGWCWLSACYRTEGQSRTRQMMCPLLTARAGPHERREWPWPVWRWMHPAAV